MKFPSLFLFSLLLTTVVVRADEMDSGSSTYWKLRAEHGLEILEDQPVALAHAIPGMPMAAQATLLGRQLFQESFREFKERDADGDSDLTLKELEAAVAEFNDEGALGACHSTCVREGNNGRCGPLQYTLMRLSWDLFCSPFDVSELDAFINALVERADTEERTGDPAAQGLDVDKDGIIVD